MMAMPYFDDFLKLAEYDSQEEALAHVEAGFATKAGGCTKLVRVDLPGGKASVFAVAINEGKGGDDQVLGTVNTALPSQVAHLPYELVVTEGRVLALHAKFRIANSFPDLTMGTFMKIVMAPGAIEDALKEVANTPVQ